MNLYEVNCQLQETLSKYLFTGDEVVDTETGAVLNADDVRAEIESLQLTLDEKIDNTALFYKNLVSDVEQLKAEEVKLQKRRRSKENLANRLKDYLGFILNGKKVDKPQYAISFRRYQALEIVDEQEIPKEFLVPQEPKVDKVAIKKALKNSTVAGVELVEKESVLIK